MLKSYFNAYDVSSQEYYAPVLMSSAESHLGLLNSVNRCVERLCEGELACLRHTKISALCLTYKIYHRVNRLCISICIIFLLLVILDP